MTIYSNKVITIQKATYNDAPLLAKFAHAAFLDAYISIAPHRKKEIVAYANEAFTLPGTVSDLENEDIQFLIIKRQTSEDNTDEKELLGYTKLNPHLHTPSLKPADTICIERFYVHPQYKSQGLGTQLMRAALEKIQESAVSSVWLNVWDINASVMDFYKRFGFEEAGIHLFNMGDHTDEDLLMIKHF